MKQLANEICEWRKFNIFSCYSQYHVLISIIIIHKCHLENSSRVIVFLHDKKSHEYFDILRKKAEKYGIKIDVIYKDRNIIRAIGISDLKNRRRINRLFSDEKIEADDIQLINFGWTQTIIRYPASILFDVCNRVIFVEEGATQVITPEDNALILLLKRIYGNQSNFWNEDKLKSIHVQNTDIYRDYLKQKIVKLTLDCNAFFDSDVLCDIFMTKEDFSEIQMIREKNVVGIIFTQPLSEDGYLSEAEKVRIYDDIASHYGKKRVCLKVHPRDCTDYSGLGIPIVRGAYPSELLKIIGCSFWFAIGLCTSAIQQVDAKYKFNLNPNYLHELSFNYVEIPKEE